MHCIYAAQQGGGVGDGLCSVHCVQPGCTTVEWCSVAASSRLQTQYIIATLCVYVCMCVCVCVVSSLGQQ